MSRLVILVRLVFLYVNQLRASSLVLLRVILTFGLLLSSQWASAQTLSISALTWNVIGLDSNQPVTSGPDTFPVGARVCNTGGAAVTNLNATLNLGAGSTVISISGASSIAYGTLTSGTATAQSPSQYAITSPAANCADLYFNVVIARAATSFNKTRTFTINVTGLNSATGLPVNISTPANRELFVEKLVSQNRNLIRQISGPTTAYVGETYVYQYLTATATGGYEQLENFIAWPSTVFQVMSVSSTYAQPTGAVNSTPYGDACGWQNDPTIPATYRSCVGPALYPGGKAGGDPIITTYTVKVISGGTSVVSGLVHDFSGSSYHYNSDFGAVTLTVLTKVRAADLAVTKTDNQTSVLQNSTTTYTIVITNAGPEPAVTTTVSDPAVVGLTKNSVTCVASAGTACPATLSVSALEGPGLVIATSSAGSTLTLTVVATVTASGGTVTNTVSVIPFSSVVDTNLTNNTATDADQVIGLVNLSITKNNGGTTLAAGSTTAYTITVANAGPADAAGSVLRDPAAAGLSCTSVNCTVATGAAVCPSAASVTIANLQSPPGSGITITSFPSGSSLNFRLICGVTATGQ